MSVRVREALTGTLSQLRYEPTAKRVRATLDGVTVADSTSAVLVWEPRRVVPTYAVPESDITADLVPLDAEQSGQSGQVDDIGLAMPDVSERPVLDPSIPFTIHTTDGVDVDVVSGRGARGQGFRPDDDALAGYVVLDFTAFDTWMEEETILSHPRDPFHRIDVLPSSRHVRLELDGTLLAESTRPTLLLETLLPTRFYIPREDVTAPLVPSSTRTRCAYKGEASYWSVRTAQRTVADLAWTYPTPSDEVRSIHDLVAFFDERVDVTVDGIRRERPRTPWSRED